MGVGVGEDMCAHASRPLCTPRELINCANSPNAQTPHPSADCDADFLWELLLLCPAHGGTADGDQGGGPKVGAC